MNLNHSIGQSIELRSPQFEQPLWRYTYGGKPKPFFHPLCTPAGFCVSLFEPHDHVWHRGLWFAIKFVNGDNFWEERSGYGTQRPLLPPAITHFAGGSIELSHDLSWDRPNDAGAAFTEARRIVYRPLNDGAYALDWDIQLTAQADLLLDRTPFTTWGGYGGLVIRGNRNWQQTRILFSDGSTSDRPVGLNARWGDLSGLFDGGPHCEGGIALFDHPKNPRHPTPWYGGTGSGHYLNAAFLFHEPMTLAEGDMLHLRYRVLIHDNIWDQERLQAAYDAFTDGGLGSMPFK